MTRRFRMGVRVRVLVAALVVLLVAGLVAGCNATTPVMMGHDSSAGARAGQAPGFGPMGRPVPHGYRTSRLTCPAPSLPGTQVFVMLGDMSMAGKMPMMQSRAPLGSHMILRAAPARVPAGQVSFVVANMGRRTHEMVVLPLSAGQSAGQRVAGPDGRVDESGSLGEASASCAAGSGEGIEPGTVGWVTLDLPAGRYELVCNLPHHYANGMRQLLVVS